MIVSYGDSWRQQQLIAIGGVDLETSEHDPRFRYIPKAFTLGLESSFET